MLVVGSDKCLFLKQIAFFNTKVNFINMYGINTGTVRICI